MVLLKVLAIALTLCVCTVVCGSEICIKPRRPCSDNAGCPGSRMKCKDGKCCITFPTIKPRCRSGVTGPTCSKSEPCKPGYKCSAGVCCRDPVCPLGMPEAGSCNTSPGQPKCKTGYECISNFCCKSRTVVLPPRCLTGLPVGPVCSNNKPCPSGRKCVMGRCCEDLVRPPVLTRCPSGMRPGGECSKTDQSCPIPGFSCINGQCCRDFVLPPRPTSCPIGMLPRGVCSKVDQSCPLPGYTCISGQCCKSGNDLGGGCPLFMAHTGAACSDKISCKIGEKCHEGKCCRGLTRPPIFGNRCPRLPINAINFCPPKSNLPPRCVEDIDCRLPNQVCCKDRCDRPYCTDPVEETFPGQL